jgi:hypothetical protein
MRHCRAWRSTGRWRPGHFDDENAIHLLSAAWFSRSTPRPTRKTRLPSPRSPRTQCRSQHESGCNRSRCVCGGMSRSNLSWRRGCRAQGGCSQTQSCDGPSYLVVRDTRHNRWPCLLPARPRYRLFQKPIRGECCDRSIRRVASNKRAHRIELVLRRIWLWTSPLPTIASRSSGLPFTNCLRSCSTAERECPLAAALPRSSFGE